MERPSRFKSNLKFLKSQEPLEESRKRTAQSPKASSNQQLQICKLCNIQPGSLKTPSCLVHTFCTSCINLNSIKFPSTFCDLCLMYFESISKEFIPNVIKCRTCKLFPDFDNFCKKHMFCKKCLNFFNSNEQKHYKIISECSECSTFFTNPKVYQKTTLKTADEKTNLPQIGQRHREYTRKSYRNELKVNTHQVINPNIYRPNYYPEEQIVNRSPVKVFASKPFQDPIPPKQISRVNLANQEKKHNNPINALYSPRRDFTPSNKPVGIVILEKIVSKSPNKIRLQSVGIISREKVSRVKKILKSGKEKPIIDIPRHQPADESQSNANSTWTLVSICFHCGKRDNSIAFDCNHNLCFECLVYTGITQIRNFFTLFSEENGIVYFEFFFECPSEDCRKKISIPTHFIFAKLQEFIDCKVERFLPYKEFIPTGFKDWEKWVPYFDGLGLPSYLD